jgi:hypothetical protein
MRLLPYHMFVRKLSRQSIDVQKVFEVQSPTFKLPDSTKAGQSLNSELHFLKRYISAFLLNRNTNAATLITGLNEDSASFRSQSTLWNLRVLGVLHGEKEILHKNNFEDE